MSTLTTRTRVQFLIPVVYLVATLAFFAWIIYAGPINLLQVVGIIVTFIAFALWLLARYQLGNSFTITPQPTSLVTHGLYSKFRHPVYVFSFLALIGIIIFLQNVYLLVPLVALALLQFTRIKKEEAILHQKYGRTYEDYRRTTWF